MALPGSWLSGSGAFLSRFLRGELRDQRIDAPLDATPLRLPLGGALGGYFILRLGMLQIPGSGEGRRGWWSWWCWRGRGGSHYTSMPCNPCIGGFGAHTCQEEEKQAGGYN